MSDPTELRVRLHEPSEIDPGEYAVDKPRPEWMEFTINLQALTIRIRTALGVDKINGPFKDEYDTIEAACVTIAACIDKSDYKYDGPSLLDLALSRSTNDVFATAVLFGITDDPYNAHRQLARAIAQELEKPHPTKSRLFMMYWRAHDFYFEDDSAGLDHGVETRRLKRAIVAKCGPIRPRPSILDEIRDL